MLSLLLQIKQCLIFNWQRLRTKTNAPFQSVPMRVGEVLICFVLLWTISVVRLKIYSNSSAQVLLYPIF